MPDAAETLCLKEGVRLSSRLLAHQRSSDVSDKLSIDGEPGVKGSLLVRGKELCTLLERSKFIALIHRRLVPIAALALGGLVIALVHRLSWDLDYHAIIHALRHVPAHAVGLSVTATALSFVAL